MKKKNLILIMMIAAITMLSACRAKNCPGLGYQKKSIQKVS